MESEHARKSGNIKGQRKRLTCTLKIQVSDETTSHSTRSLSDLKNRSENSAERGQILPVLQVNSRSIDQKSGEIWTAQADLQPISFKSDRLLGRGHRPAPYKTQRIHQCHQQQHGQNNAGRLLHLKK